MGIMSGYIYRGLGKIGIKGFSSANGSRALVTPQKVLRLKSKGKSQDSPLY